MGINKDDVLFIISLNLPNQSVLCGFYNYITTKGNYEGKFGAKFLKMYYYIY